MQNDKSHLLESDFKRVSLTEGEAHFEKLNKSVFICNIEIQLKQLASERDQLL